MSDFQVIGIEMHSRSMWYHAQVKKALDFMEENGFNALIFHQSDIVNKLAFPKQYLDSHFSVGILGEGDKKQVFLDYINEPASARLSA